MDSMNMHDVTFEHIISAPYCLIVNTTLTIFDIQYFKPRYYLPEFGRTSTSVAFNRGVMSEHPPAWVWDDDPRDFIQRMKRLVYIVIPR